MTDQQHTETDLPDEDIPVTYEGTLYDRVAEPLGDGTPAIEGLPYCAEYDGLRSAATSPEGARWMIRSMLSRRRDRLNRPAEGGDDRG